MKRVFTKEEVEEHVFLNDVHTYRGGSRRWSRTNETVVKVDGKFYKLYWEQGLTESQENYFEEQETEEVELKEYEKTIKVSEWIIKK